jgi:hypothetical protein
MSDLQRLTIVSNELEAEIACELLRSEGIPCMYRLTDMAFGGGGEMPLSGGGPREILVHAERLAEARELFQALT